MMAVKVIAAAQAQPALRDDIVRGDFAQRIIRGLPHPIRSMRRFALEEIRLPSGPRQGLMLSVDVQPFTGLLLDELDRRDPATGGRYWNRVNLTGPRQCGKTLYGSALPVLYHLCEVGETVIYGVPDLDMAKDKWNIDLLPVIEKTRYRELLPSTGSGSRGGFSMSMELRNGARLRFMSGGGGAHGRGRVGFTSRVLVVTELNAFGVSVETSDEGSKLSELEGCISAYKNALIYQECTVTTKECLIWSHYVNGSHARILVQCPHCRQWVEMERPQLIGHQDAESEGQAMAESGWFCPKCGERITEPERVEMNRGAKLVHGKQEIDESGEVRGDMPLTRTLGFRWSAFHNLFTDASILGGAEWTARQQGDADLAERAILQYRWCEPYRPNLLDGAPLDPKDLMKRIAKFPHREIPPDTTYLTLAIDPGKWHCWYLLLAFRANGQVHIPDYGVFKVASDFLKEEVALFSALREFRDTVNAGWPVVGTGKNRTPDANWIDAGHLPGVVHQFVNESGGYPSGPWFTTIGRGASTIEKQAFMAHKRTTNEVRKIGDGWFVSRQQQHRSWVVTINSDAWILWFQNGLRLPVSDAGGNPTPGAVTLFDPGPNKMVARMHNDITRHFANEQLTQEMVEGRGLVQKWDTHGRHDHLDCAKIAAAAGNYLGFNLTASVVNAPSATPTLNEWLAGRPANNGRR